MTLSDCFQMRDDGFLLAQEHKRAAALAADAPAADAPAAAAYHANEAARLTRLAVQLQTMLAAGAISFPVAKSTRLDK